MKDSNRNNAVVEINTIWSREIQQETMSKKGIVFCFRSGKGRRKDKIQCTVVWVTRSVIFTLLHLLTLSRN